MEKRTTEESHDKSVWTTDSQTSLHHPLTEKEKENVAFSRHTAQKSLATHGQGAIDSQQTSVPLETFIPFLGNPPFLLSQHSKGPHISIDDVCPNICFKALPVTVPGPVVPKSPKKMDRVESVTVSSSIETQGPPPTLSLGRTKNTIVSKPLEVDQAYGPPYIHPDDYLIGPHSAIYQPFLSLEQANKEIEAKTLVHGPLRIRHTRHMEGYVTCDALNDDVIIHNLIDRNRGLEGDIVAVRLKSLRKKGKKPTKRKGVFKKVSILHYDTMEDQLKKQDNDDDNDDDNNDNNDNDNNDNDGNDGNDGNDDKENTHKYYGEVVAILQRLGTTLHTGTLSVQMPVHAYLQKQERVQTTNEVDRKTEREERERRNQNAERIWFRPSDVRVPLTSVSIDNAPLDILWNEEHYQTHISTIHIQQWPISSKFPLGVVIDSKGCIGDLNTEMEAILIDSDVKERPWSSDVLESLPSPEWTIPSSEISQRRDQRQACVFTIDPVSAKDLDDALHIQQLGEDMYEVGVHIADVSYFVKENTPLDTGARKRGTSTYLANSTLPMLPPVLSEELCSLSPDKDRLAVSVIWTMDKYGHIQSTWLGRSIIRSCTKLSYEYVQSVIDGDSLPDSTQVFGHSLSRLQTDLFDLFKLSQSMRKRRYNNGALSIPASKLHFTLNAQGEPEEAHLYTTKEANHLVEEFMLQANISVAKAITDHFPGEAFLRRHAPPFGRKMKHFIQTAQALGYEMDASNAGTLQSSFEQIEDPQSKQVLAVLAARSMQRATYFSSGTLDPTHYSHYALNETVYTHFTSPIRRYSDIIVHRQLLAALSHGPVVSQKELQMIAQICNQKRLGATYAEEKSTHLYLAHFLHNAKTKHKSRVQTALVISILNSAYEVYIPMLNLVRRIYMESLPLVKYHRTPTCIDMHWKRGIVPSSLVEKRLQTVQRDSTHDYYEYTGDTSEEEDHPKDPTSSQEKKAYQDGVLSDDSESMNEQENAQCIQTVSVFSEIIVMLEVNMTCSPPIIHVYPVNPFL